MRLLAPMSLLAIAGVLLTSMHGSCRQEASTDPGRSLATTGIPTLRVLLTPKAVARATIATSGAYRIGIDGREITTGSGPLEATEITRQDSLWCLNLLRGSGREVLVEPSPGESVRVGAVSYRGTLRLLPVGEQQFLIINSLDLESYLAGVLAKELYPSWSLEAYRALAVAARTFAMYYKLTFGKSNEYDIGSTQTAQVYGGFSAETPKAWQAVRSTRGHVLAFGRNGDERIFMAQYSACCGGRVNGAEVLRDAADIEPLHGGQGCPFCSGCSRYRWQPVRISKVDLYRALVRSYKAVERLSDVTKLRVIEENSHGRIVWVDVLDTGGQSVRLRADDIRLSLLRANIPAARKLYSMNCRFREASGEIEFYDGRGFGHGVGLCQWGAQGQAAQGGSGEEILKYYYPGAKMFRAY